MFILKTRTRKLNIWTVVVWLHLPGWLLLRIITYLLVIHDYILYIYIKIDVQVSKPANFIHLFSPYQKYKECASSQKKFGKWKCIHTKEGTSSGSRVRLLAGS